MSDSQMISVPRDEVERLVKLLQYQAHPHPSPHAECWQGLPNKLVPAGSVQRFWSHEAQNIRCVREADYDALGAGLRWESERNSLLLAELQGAESRLQGEPVAVVLPDRSPEDYAIEHAEYMAKSADDVLAKFQAYGLALLAVDEGGEEGEGELFEAIDTARGDLQESLVDLRGMVYEFRKRRDRIARRTGETAQ